MSAPLLAAEIKRSRAPVRWFLNEHFGRGLYEIERRNSYYKPPPWMIVPPGDCDPGLMEIAAGWLLRFQVDPSPDVSIAWEGVAMCAGARIDVRAAVGEIAEALGIAEVGVVRQASADKPRASTADPTLLARACWVLAALTHAARGDSGPAHRAAVQHGALRPFHGGRATAKELLELAPQDVINQLAAFRHIFATRLLPDLGATATPWVAAPRLVGERLLRAEPCLITGGTLLHVTTPTVRPKSEATSMYRAIAAGLLDFDDKHGIRSVGVFSARYAELKTWHLESILAELAGAPVDLAATREQFRETLEQWY